MESGATDTFSRNLRRLMHAASVSTAELAAACGVSVRTVQTWRRGTRRPSFETLALIAQRLRCGVGDLLEGVGLRTATEEETPLAA